MSTYPNKDIQRAAEEERSPLSPDGPLRPDGPCHPERSEGSPGLDDASLPGGSFDSASFGRSAQDGGRNDPARPRRSPAPRAVIASVEPESPADDVGFEPGCLVTSVDGQPVRDLIDWRWLTCDDEIDVGYVDLDGDAGVVTLEREEGQPWGIEFDGVVFDGVKQCRNACTFCFMRQLPDDMRPSLTLRDDDFRLSFLAGTFVTFTNIGPEDEARIIEQHISPLRFSLHVADPAVRRRMIGRNAAHGLEVADRLLAAGIECHVQIVLVPDENDGEVLADTLEWAWERPGLLDICIVPLGYTKHQSGFERSFNEPDQARKVLECVRPFQERALEQRGTLWAYPSDELYHSAFGRALLDNLPATEHYGDFEMFEDGVGIIRSFVDDWQAACEEGDAAARCAAALRAAGVTAYYIVGCAMRDILDVLVERGPLRGAFVPLFVKNDYFGGNVDVTGLLCGCDMVAAVNRAAAAVGAGAPGASIFLIPEVVFNDDGVTLDDMSFEDMERASVAPLAVVSCNASAYLEQIIDLVEC